jgi:phosphoribosylformylglycinamidine synthase
VIGEVTEGTYVCTFEGETVVDVDAEFLGDGAPMNDLDREEPSQPERDRPDVELRSAFDAVLASPNTASKRWVYRQYDHEVGTRTAVRPGDDAALLAIREAGGVTEGADEAGRGVGLALSAGAAPNWTDVAPYEGARAVALENATNLAAKGATPLAAVDCLNGGNPEKPDVYGGFAGIVDGLAEMCSTLDVPVVGGNVSLYNDSPSGPIPPTPTVAMTGTKRGYDAPRLAAEPVEESELLLVGDRGLESGDPALGGSELLACHGGTDRVPTLPDQPADFVETLASVADDEDTLAVHDVSHGGLAVSLAEMITADAGLAVELPGDTPVAECFHEQPGRALVQTTAPERVRDAFDGCAPVRSIGAATADGCLSLTVGDVTIERTHAEIGAARETVADALE